MSKAEYQKYLQSEHWKKLKQAKTPNKKKRRCAICGSRQNIQHHHLRYKHLYDVQTSDLRRLCDECHRTTHELINSGVLKITSRSHNGIFAQTKAAVKKARGLYGNCFWEMADPIAHLIANVDATDKQLRLGEL